MAAGAGSRGRRPLLVASLAASACTLLYALYRAYYGLGGTIGMIGTPTSESSWRATNLGAAGVLLAIAALPLAALPLWGRDRWRRVLIAVAWLLAVGGVMHALIMDVQRVASLAGIHRIHYPASFWRSHDDRMADLQDLIFNETWFLAEGLLWGLLAWIAIGHVHGRRRWLAGALTATAGLTCIGLLSAFGVVGRAVVA